MASKRSNKTARVLNLIATPSDAAPVEAEQSTVPAASAETQATPAAAPKEKARSGAKKPRIPPKLQHPNRHLPYLSRKNLRRLRKRPHQNNRNRKPLSAPMPQPVVPIVQTVREKELRFQMTLNQGCCRP